MVITTVITSPQLWPRTEQQTQTKLCAVGNKDLEWYKIRDQIWMTAWKEAFAYVFTGMPGLDEAG